MDWEEILEMATKVLGIAGAANWVLYGFGVNLVDKFVGSIPWLASTIYVAAGASGVYQIVKKWKE